MDSYVVSLKYGIIHSPFREKGKRDMAMFSLVLDINPRIGHHHYQSQVPNRVRGRAESKFLSGSSLMGDSVCSHKCVHLHIFPNEMVPDPYGSYHYMQVYPENLGDDLRMQQITSSPSVESLPQGQTSFQPDKIHLGRS